MAVPSIDRWHMPSLPQNPQPAARFRAWAKAIVRRSRRRRSTGRALRSPKQWSARGALSPRIALKACARTSAARGCDDASGPARAGVRRLARCCRRIARCRRSIASAATRRRRALARRRRSRAMRVPWGGHDESGPRHPAQLDAPLRGSATRATYAQHQPRSQLHTSARERWPGARR